MVTEVPAPRMEFAIFAIESSMPPPAVRCFANASKSTTQPLLNNSEEDLRHSNGDVLFNVSDEDEDEYIEASALNHTDSPRSKAVRFQEEVQVYTAPLRSTAESRETGA